MRPPKKKTPICFIMVFFLLSPTMVASDPKVKQNNKTINERWCFPLFNYTSARLECERVFVAIQGCKSLSENVLNAARNISFDFNQNSLKGIPKFVLVNKRTSVCNCKALRL